MVMGEPPVTCIGYYADVCLSGLVGAGIIGNYCRNAPNSAPNWTVSYGNVRRINGSEERPIEQQDDAIAHHEAVKATRIWKAEREVRFSAPLALKEAPTG